MWKINEGLLGDGSNNIKYCKPYEGQDKMRYRFLYIVG